MKFTQEHEMFRQTVRRFVEQEINPHVDEWEEAGIFPAHELFKKMGDLGFLGLTYPEEYGGQGLDFWYTVVFCEELGQANCLRRPDGHHRPYRYVYARAGAFWLARAEAAVSGAEHSRRDGRLHRRHRARRRLGCRRDPHARVADGDDWVINGRKLYITNGTQADWVCLLARTSDEAGYRGMSLIIVPTKTPGFSVSRKLRKLGNHSSDTAELMLDDVRVPEGEHHRHGGHGLHPADAAVPARAARRRDHVVQLAASTPCARPSPIPSSAAPSASR